MKLLEVGRVRVRVKPRKERHSPAVAVLALLRCSSTTRFRHDVLRERKKKKYFECRQNKGRVELSGPCFFWPRGSSAHAETRKVSTRTKREKGEKCGVTAAQGAGEGERAQLFHGRRLRPPHTHKAHMFACCHSSLSASLSMHRKQFTRIRPFRMPP